MKSCLKVTVKVGGIKETIIADKVSISEDYAIITKETSTLYFKYYDIVDIEVFP